MRYEKMIHVHIDLIKNIRFILKVDKAAFNSIFTGFLK